MHNHDSSNMGSFMHARLQSGTSRRAGKVMGFLQRCFCHARSGMQNLLLYTGFIIIGMHKHVMACVSQQISMSMYIKALHVCIWHHEHSCRVPRCEGSAILAKMVISMNPQNYYHQEEPTNEGPPSPRPSGWSWKFGRDTAGT